MEDVIAWGGQALFSCLLDTRSEVWQAMHHNVPTGYWQGAINSAGVIVASCVAAKNRPQQWRGRWCYVQEHHHKHFYCCVVG